MINADSLPFARYAADERTLGKMLTIISIIGRRAEIVKAVFASKWSDAHSSSYSIDRSISNAWRCPGHGCRGGWRQDCACEFEAILHFIPDRLQPQVGRTSTSNRWRLSMQSLGCLPGSDTQGNRNQHWIVEATGNLQRTATASRTTWGNSM